MFSEKILGLTPNDTHIFTISSGEKIEIQKCRTHFLAWTGKELNNTYGGKQVLDLEGEPVFAELLILRLFQKEGWQGAWVDTYGKKYRVGLPSVAEPVSLPPAEVAIIDGIASRAGGFKGCWDVYLWKGDEHMFVELKRQSKDAIRETQIRWLEASISMGFSPSSFLVVEWDIDHPKQLVEELS